MKSIIVFTGLLALALSSFFSQSTKEDYRKKAKKQSTIGGIVLGTGCATLLAGFIFNPQVGVSVGGNNNTSSEKVKTSGTLYVIGGVLTAVSIPFFILASSNKRKARETAAVGFKMENIQLVSNEGFTASSLPSISLKIPL